jgi:hypothetical protein
MAAKGALARSLGLSIAHRSLAFPQPIRIGPRLFHSLPLPRRSSQCHQHIPSSFLSSFDVQRSFARYNSTQTQTATKSEPSAPVPSTAPPSPSSSAVVPATTDVSPPATTAKPDASSIYKLLLLAKPQWRLISVGVGCLVISTAVNLSIPYVIGRIIDFFAPGSDATLLFGLPLEKATAVLALGLLIGAAANGGRSIALRLAGQRTVARIR